jgi:indolepyruvate ferredoxin oxidoreductase
VLIADDQDAIRTTRVSAAAADLIIGCDPIVTGGKETVLRMRQGRTRVALNAHGTPTAAFVKNGAWDNPSDACATEIGKAVGAEQLAALQADALAERVLGDSIYTNPLMLGFAWQKGWVPLARESILRAMELNAVQVENNKAAFEWGRRAAHDPASVAGLLAPAGQVIEFKKRETLETVIARRVEFLTDYQNAAYAQRYQDLVERVRVAELPLGKSTLTEAVAKGLFRLMAYKDEYEVARLHAQTGFREKVAAQFEGDFKIHYHLAPPIIAKRNDKGELVKRKFGPATFHLFRLLARLKGLRGTALDVFGHTEERRTERALIEEYQQTVLELVAGLQPGNHALAVEIARLPEQIKGYGHVKERNLAAVRPQWDSLLQQWRGAAPQRHAA